MQYYHDFEHKTYCKHISTVMLETFFFWVTAPKNVVAWEPQHIKTFIGEKKSYSMSHSSRNIGMKCLSGSRWVFIKCCNTYICIEDGMSVKKNISAVKLFVGHSFVMKSWLFIVSINSLSSFFSFYSVQLEAQGASP